MLRNTVTRREVLIGGSSLVSLLALAGCGAGPATTPSSAQSLGDDTEKYLRSVGKSLGTSSLGVLAYAAPQAQSIQELSPQFTDLTGIKLDWTVLDEQSAANKASVALGSSGGGYDVVHTTSSLMPSYAKRNWLAPFADLVKKNTVPGWNADAYGSTITSLLSGTELLAAPSFIGTQIFFYRTDLFEKAGISAVPTTYQELADTCAKVTGTGVKGIALRSAPSPSQLMFVWSAWLYAFGGEYYGKRNGAAYSDPGFDSPAAVRALTLFTDLLRNDAPTGATNWSVEDVVRAFSTGRTAIIQEGAVFAGTFNNPKTSQIASKVGTFVMPKGTAGQFVPFNCHGWGVAANSKNADAAAVFAQWATLERTLISATQAKTPFSTPPLTSVYRSAPYHKRYGFDDYVASVTKTIELANTGAVSPIKGDPNYLPGTPSWNTTGQRVCEQLSLAVTGQLKPADAIAEAAKAIQAAS